VAAVVDQTILVRDKVELLLILSVDQVVVEHKD
jgi:hypothetical protein